MQQAHTLEARSFEWNVSVQPKRLDDREAGTIATQKSSSSSSQSQRSNKCRSSAVHRKP